MVSSEAGDEENFTMKIETNLSWVVVWFGHETKQEFCATLILMTREGSTVISYIKLFASMLRGCNLIQLTLQIDGGTGRLRKSNL
jgi:hypothetical protein